MKLPTPLPASTPVTDSKIDVLARFIVAHCGAARAADGAANTLTVVARSAQSPVCQALAQVGGAIAAEGLTVRLIMATLADDAATTLWTAGNSDLAFAREIRWARHPRLIEAHEQCGVGPHATWLGDCMRRDPGKRDALEQFKPDCRQTAGFAATSFERLWKLCESVALRMPRQHDGALSQAGMLSLIGAVDGNSAVDKRQGR